MIVIWIIFVQAVIANPVPIVTFHQLIVPPKSHRATSASGQSRKERRVAHAQVVSSSPYLKQLQEAKQNKDTPVRIAGVKRKLCLQKRNDSEKKEPKKDQNKKKEKKTSADNKRKVKDVVPCDTCGLRFCDDKSGRRWTQCQICSNWFHNSCQGLPEKTVRSFCCINCDN